MNLEPATNLTHSQQRAIETFRRYLTRELDKNEDRGDAIVQFDVQVTPMGQVWISAKTEMTKLPEGNALRFVAATHWHVAVGKCGALEVWSAPKSFDQFRGRRAFGMSFAKI